jgi:hypothetical protein
MTEPHAPDPADVELAAEALAREWGYDSLAEVDSVRDREGEAVRSAVRAVLAAFDGRLLPADAETRTEWSVRVTMLDGRTHMALPALAPLMTQHMAEQAAARFAGPGWSNVAKAEPVSRTTSIGPWLPAPTTEEI